jgi:hypothetical protein
VEVSGDERCPSCGAKVGEIVQVRHQGRLTYVRFLEDDGDGAVAEVDHVCGD